MSGATGPLTHASVYPIGAPQTIPADAYTPVHGQYHNRNRMYSPALGRFLSRDPNALGTPVLSDLSFGGMTLDASDVGPDLTAHYADGLNTHAAYGSNPLTRSDALGLMTTAHLAPLAPGIATRILHNMLWGIGVGGVMGYMQDGWRGAASGAVAGAVGGGVFGAMSGGAFASGAGLLARVSSGATAAGVSGWAGGFAGSAVQQDLRGQSFNLLLALADANWGMAVGILTGGVGGAFTRGQADDILLQGAGFGGSSFSLRAYYTANELTSHGWGGDRLTRAAVDLRKHPNILGVGNVQALVRSSAIELNQLANDVIERILANASSGRVLPSGDIDIPLPGAAQGLGARFSSDGTFRYFTGMSGRNN